jgi:hypothetical protein
VRDCFLLLVLLMVANFFGGTIFCVDADGMSASLKFRGLRILSSIRTDCDALVKYGNLYEPEMACAPRTAVANANSTQ